MISSWVQFQKNHITLRHFTSNFCTKLYVQNGTDLYTPVHFVFSALNHISSRFFSLLAKKNKKEKKTRKGMRGFRNGGRRVSRIGDRERKPKAQSAIWTKRYRCWLLHGPLQHKSVYKYIYSILSTLYYIPVSNVIIRVVHVQSLYCIFASALKPKVA